MGGMIWYEWKKIWGSRLTQLSVLGCALFFLFGAWSNVSQIFAEDEQGNMVTGIQAEEILKQVQKNQVLTQEHIEGIMQEYLDEAERIYEEEDDPEAASDLVRKAVYMPRKDLYDLIARAYDNWAGTETIAVFQENLGRDFYQARREAGKAYTARLEMQGVVTAEEAAYWNARNASVEEYSYGYRKGWECVLNNMPWGILIMMIVCVGTAPVFAGEYQSKCDSLFLCMKYGKNRLPMAKIIAAWLYASLVYLGITLLWSGVILLYLGAQGWELPVQLLRASSAPASYNVTFGQAFLLELLLGYVLTLSIMAVTLWMSSVFKNPYGVIVAAFLLLIVPTFLLLAGQGYVLYHVLSLLPAKIMDFTFFDYTAYSVGGKVLSCLSADLIVNGAAAVLFSAAGYGMFRRHQVNQ